MFTDQISDRKGLSMRKHFCGAGIGLIAVAACVLALSAAGPQTPVTSSAAASASRPANAAPATGATAATGEWRYYASDAKSTKYSPLDQINAANVKDLQIAWRWKSENSGPRPEINWQVTPLMVGGKLYVTAGGVRRQVAAIDAATGETLWTWRFDEGRRGELAPWLSNRGLSYWTDGKGTERILYVTPGYRLIALDAKTGDPDPKFGDKGIVDLRQGLDQPEPPDGIIGSSSPPMIVGDVAIVGASLQTGLNPVSKANTAAFVRGFDVRTGKRLWIFHTIPRAGEFGNETWENDSWKYTGNGGVWPPMSADLELGYVYLPVEEGTGDYYGGHRPGNNLFTDSLVCLDARTGKRIWHFQLIHHGVWDSDPPAAPNLVDIRVAGRPIKAVAQITKQGFVFVFDRVTGEPVWPIVEKPVPPSEVPGEKLSPTQPFPSKPPAFERQGLSPDDLIDFTPQLKAEALEIIKGYKYGPLYTPLLPPDSPLKGLLMQPPVTGGGNWQGAAIDPETGMMYVPSVTNPGIMPKLIKGDPQKTDMNYVAERGSGGTPNIGPQGLPLAKPPWGRITAIDLNAGEIRWVIPLGEAPDYVKAHPALKGVDLSKTGRPERAGLLVTKTLLFGGEGFGGTGGPGGGGPMFRAYDKQTGKTVWEFKMPANQSGMPMTYMVQGQQYIAVAIGARGVPAELVAFALPKK